MVRACYEPQCPVWWALAAMWQCELCEGLRHTAREPPALLDKDAKTEPSPPGLLRPCQITAADLCVLLCVCLSIQQTVQWFPGPTACTCLCADTCSVLWGQTQGAVDSSSRYATGKHLSLPDTIPVPVLPVLRAFSFDEQSPKLHITVSWSVCGLSSSLCLLALHFGFLAAHLGQIIQEETRWRFLLFSSVGAQWSGNPQLSLLTSPAVSLEPASPSYLLLTYTTCLLQTPSCCPVLSARICFATLLPPTSFSTLPLAAFWQRSQNM